MDSLKQFLRNEIIRRFEDKDLREKCTGADGIVDWYAVYGYSEKHKAIREMALELHKETFGFESKLPFKQLIFEYIDSIEKTTTPQTKIIK